MPAFFCIYDYNTSVYQHWQAQFNIFPYFFTFFRYIFDLQINLTPTWTSGKIIVVEKLRAYSSAGPEPAAHNRLVVGSNPTRPTICRQYKVFYTERKSVNQNFLAAKQKMPTSLWGRLVLLRINPLQKNYLKRVWFFTKTCRVYIFKQF